MAGQTPSLYAGATIVIIDFTIARAPGHRYPRLLAVLESSTPTLCR